MEDKHKMCPHFKKCGGCQYLDMSYSDQLTRKQGHAIALLGQFGHVSEIIGMEQPEHYRNKVCAAFGLDAKKHIISGIYKQNSHAIVPVDSCLLEDKKADRIICDIRGMMREFKMQAFDERSCTGFLRHVLVRRGFTSGEIMVVLVVTEPIFKLQKPFLKKLLEMHPEISTVVLNINDRFTPVVLGTREKVIYGSGYIEDTLCSHRFRISSRSFYQINPVQTEKLYSAAIELAGLTGNETVLDAYCGIGTIGITASAKAKQVVGVELNRDAVRDAIANARLNGIKNCWFTAGDAGEYMQRMAADKVRPDVVFMDPPRSGSDEKFLSALLTAAPDKIVYISCGIDTLARDLRTLTLGGYKVQKIQPVDMFPYTSHVETVVLLSKGEISSRNIRVEFSLEDMDITSLRGKATYDQIKGYIEERFGMKVSTLYISQIKRKCGLEVGESYNKSKNEDSKVPVCPPEKEMAIMDALKHFGII